MRRNLLAVFLGSLCLTACADDVGRDGSPGDGALEPEGAAGVAGDAMPGAACRLDADCTLGEGCVLGRCVATCEDDEDCGEVGVCGVRGRCADPLPARAGEAVMVSVSGDASEGGFSVEIHNPDPVATTVRLDALVEGLSFDRRPLTLASGETATILVTVPPQVNPQALPAALRVKATTGSVPVPMGIFPPTTGEYLGTVDFEAGRRLGGSDLRLNLEVLDGGELTGQTFSDRSFLWPEDLVVHGTWAEGQVTVVLQDRLSTEAEGVEEVRSAVGREVGRKVILHGVVADDGVTVEGTVTEVLSGLQDADVVVTGEFMLRRIGDLAAPSGMAVDHAEGPGPTFPEADFDEALDAGVCEGLGEDWGLAESDLDQEGADACAACAELECEAVTAFACGAWLLAGGDHLEETIEIGEISVETSSAGATPEGWVECSELTADHNPCLDMRMIPCAGAMARVAMAQTGPGEELVARGLLDQLDREITAAGMIGLGHLVDAGLAMTQTLATDTVDAELHTLQMAQDRFSRPMRVALSPGTLRAVAALGPAVIGGEREGRDLTNVLAVSGHQVDTIVLQMRLLARTRPGDRAVLRRATGHAATWLHAHGALLGQLMAANDVGDPLGELAVFAEGMDDLRNLDEELQPGHEPLGFDPAHVPILLSAEHAASGTSNFELIRDAAQPSLSAFEGTFTAAKSALDAYEQGIYDADQRADNVAEGYDDRLIALCGVSELDVGAPDLEHCGVSGGTIHEATIAVEGERIRIKQANAALQANLDAIQIEEDRVRSIALVHEEIDASLDHLSNVHLMILNHKGEQLSIVNAEEARAQCSAGTAEWGIGLGEQGLDLAVSAGVAIASGNAGSVPSKAIGFVKSALFGYSAARRQCKQLREQAGFANDRIEIETMASQELFLNSKEMDSVLREGARAEQYINHLATVRTLMLANAGLSLELDAAGNSLELSLARLDNAYRQAASLVARKERALKRISADPQNPYLNPSFLVLRNELGKRLGGARERALRWSWRVGRALEYELNRELPAVEAELYRARSPQEVEGFVSCLGDAYQTYKIAYGSPQQHVTEVSVRRDLLGMTETLVDPVTNEPVPPAAQFHAYLMEPDHLLPDGSVELVLAMPLQGDAAQFSELLCDDRIAALEVKLIGDQLGDEAAVVMIGRDGISELRRCDGEDLPSSEAIQSYALDARRVAIQAGINDWGTAPPNGGLAGWPVAGQQWVLTIPSADRAPENADLSIEAIDDVVVRVHHRAGTVAAQGAVEFVPTCD